MNMNYLTAVSLENPLPAGSYLSSLPAVRWLEQGHTLSLSQPVTFFVGENGSGKSTLLEAIAVGMGFNPEGGSRNYAFSTADSHSPLYEYLTFAKTRRCKDGFFLRAESFYNTAAYLDTIESFSPHPYSAYGGKSLLEQSHGESFLALMQNRFSGSGLYLLDEPEAALSPQNQLSMLCILHDLVKNNSQFIIATHSPILMAYPGAEILLFEKDGLVPAEYRETDHYRLTKRFLEDPERILKLLFEEEE